ncbi:unnamed protein product [Heterosigma akashiwo]|mmetsp:Transcript_19252/g.30246  ORF Transcript_19252/g.30246 Transcript_19252/m.30246 type:complete len:165 (+) Transcript_19252:81-575(+)
MKLCIVIFACIAHLASCFSSIQMGSQTQAKLSMIASTSLNRREVIFGLGAAAAGFFVDPKRCEAGTANPFLEKEINFEPSQMMKGDKIDLNGAIVVDYKAFPGMYPHAAGKLASNGPYKSVKDIYKIDGLSSNDIKMFKKYEKEFTALPPGRMFSERINQRQST